LRATAADLDVPSDPGEYSYTVEGPRVGMSAELPADWPDRSITPWSDLLPGAPEGSSRQPLGTFLLASTDEAAIFADPDGTYDVPLVILSASKRLASDYPVGVILEMRDVEYRFDCELVTEGVLAVGDYVGPYEIYGNCIDAKALVVQAELRSLDGSHLVGVNARLASDRDVRALEHALQTMRIDPSELPR
jgi:hypothetical protein